jgi:rod shape-determining protein MreB and related proteins
VAIDLGTSSTLVYQQGAGIVYSEPTVVAMNPRNASVQAIGRHAWELVAETPSSVVAVRPMARGAITNFELTEQMLRSILKKVDTGRLGKPRALVCVPSRLTPVERRAVEDAVEGAGARSVQLIEQALAAAIGAGLPIQDPVGTMVVDVGGESSEMAMLAMGGVVHGSAVPVGGRDMDLALQAHLRHRHRIAIGETTAEQLKIRLGSAYPAADAIRAEVQGRDLETGEGRTVIVTPEEVREVLAGPIEAVVEATKTCLAESPPDLAHDVLDTGVFLTGGGGLLRGLDMRLAQECEVPVHLSEHPLLTVVLGAGRLLDYEPGQREAFLALTRR